MRTFSDRTLRHWPWVAITLAHLLGMAMIPVLETDSAQYANIAREMVENGHWLDVKHRAADYLDKPPLLFWLSAISFKLLGYGHFAFRLPAFIATLLGVFAVWRIGRRLYGAEAGNVAALSLYGCQAWYLFTHDLRTDTLLTASVAVATWQLLEYLETRRWYWLLGGFTALACAMLAKGPIGLLAPILALAGHLAAKGRWRDFLRWEWLLGGGWILLLLGPMLWGLWQQYGAGGWYFFFWKQSFGRLTGENEWKNNTDPFFLWHSFLWAFLPGSLAVGVALWQHFIRLLKGKWQGEMLPVAGFILPLLALSFSKYKLPHYAYVAFPFAALLVGEAFVFFRKKINTERPRRQWGATITQGLLLLAAAALIGLLGAWAFPCRTPWPWLLAGATGLTGIWVLWRGSPAQQLWLPGICAILSANFFLNTHFFPALLEYQAGVPISRFLQAQPQGTAIAYYRVSGHALEFYQGQKMTGAPNLCPVGALVVTDSIGLAEFQQAGRPFEIVGKWPFYSVSKISAKFLDPKQRAARLTPWYVIRVN